MKNKSKFVIIAVLALLVSIAYMGLKVRAEQSPGTPESGATSRLKTLYDDLETLTFGADTDTPDWGTLWNRIKTAAKWTPTITSTADDVRNGKTFVANGSRETSTGTYPAPESCQTQNWSDSYAEANQTDNCSLTWTVPDPSVTGDDKQDPRTGLIWSQALRNNSGTVGFSTSGHHWSWDGTTDADSIAVGGKTALQLCSERGDGWRLPSQKELIQAYIDGSYFNLTYTNQLFWASTQTNSTNAWTFNLSNGNAGSYAFTTSYYVRCVREQ